ncbi:MAG: LuxR C-terminal-related transcriptional regulator [Microthrixaceae bacterium]
MTPRWPLVGRDLELERVSRLVASSGVVIAGPPGVGKTRLVDEVVRRASDTPTLQIRATRASATMPLGAFARVLPQFGGDGQLSETLQLRDAAAHLLADLDPDQVLLLSVDDVHALDDTSATLLLHLAMTRRVRLVLTLRSGEQVPEPITMLWRDELVGRVDLQPLDEAQIADLLDLVLEGGVDGIASSALSRVCAGNLLYLRELVAGLRDSGALSLVGSTWFLLGPITAPPRLTELVAQRLDGLSAPARELLDAVALGEPLGIHPLEREGRLELVDELVGAGLVELVVDGRRRQLRSAHPMHAEVARATMPESVRRRLLVGLADAAVTTGLRRRDDAMRLAAWRLDAGEAADPRALVDGARRALVGSDMEMARRFAGAALSASRDGDPALRHESAHLMGLALDALGRSEEAEDVLGGVEPLAGDGSDRAMLAMARSDNLFRGLGRREDAERVLLDAAAAVGDEVLLDELLAQRAIFSTFAGEVDRTLELIAPLLDSGDERAFCQAALQAAVAHMLAGRSDLAIEIATRAFETRIELGEQVQLADPGIYLVALGLAQAEAGRIDAAVGTASAGYDGAVAVRDRHGQAWMSTLLARAHLLAGRPASSARCAREAAVVFGDLRHPGARWGLGSLALAAGHLGDAPGAEDAVSDLDAERDSPVRLMDRELDRGRAWALVAAGRTAAAMDVLDASAERARADGHASLESALHHDIARLGDASRVLDRLVELEQQVHGELVRARVLHTRGLAERDPATLDSAAAAFGAIGAALFAAEAATGAAELHGSAGSARAAAASAATASSYLARCEGAATPALRAGSGASELTRREREVARLAGSGLTNREIADQLVVSIRTVENHLQRAYDKLGIRRRDELPAAMSRTATG